MVKLYKLIIYCIFFNYRIKHKKKNKNISNISNTLTSKSMSNTAVKHNNQSKININFKNTQINPLKIVI